MAKYIDKGWALATACSGLTREIEGELWIRVNEVKESLKAAPTIDKVWLVWKSKYSDAHVVAVFSSKEKAEEFVENHNKYTTDEWEKCWLDANYDGGYEIDSEEIEVPTYIAVTISNNGVNTEVDYDPVAKPSPDRYEKTGVGQIGIFRTVVNTSDVGKAVKVASERRACYLNKLIEEGKL